MLGETLTRQLATIHRNRRIAPSQYYVSFTPDGNPVFENERSYEKPAYPDPGYRLLALYRYWNIIEYWFPYRDLIDEDRDRLLAEFIPRVMGAANEHEYVLEMMALVARIDDGHASIPQAWQRRPPAGDCRLPVAVRYAEKKFIVYENIDSTLAARSGLEIGDVVKSIEGQPMERLTKTIAPYYGASNHDGRRYVMSFTMTNGPCGPCEVVVDRDGKSVTVESIRAPITEMMSWGGGAHDVPGPTFQKLVEDVAYIKLSSIKADDTASYIEQAAGTRALIIDARGYPNEFVPFALGQHLVKEPTPFASFTKGDATNPGAFVWWGPATIEPKAPYYEGKVAVLVDESTVSQAEYTAMAFRVVPGAVVVGNTTAGADGNMSFIPLPGGLRTGMSGIGIFYADRTPTQQVGIVPDLVVRPTIKGIREGRDEVAEAAVRHLTGREHPIASR
jgi:C-terminal processing protease CtpA/Prc